MDRLKRWATLDAVFIISLAAIAVGAGLLWGLGAALVVAGVLGVASSSAVAVARARTGEEGEADA